MCTLGIIINTHQPVPLEPVLGMITFNIMENEYYRGEHEICRHKEARKEL